MQAANSQLPVEFDLTSIWRRPTGIFRYAAEVAKNLLLLEECEPRIRHVPFLKYLFLARGRRTAALLVDPLNAEEIATAMCQVLQDEEMRVRMIQDGRHWVSHFSWE